MKNTNEAGFSYIDVMVALVILMFGILGMMSALAAGVFQARGQQQQLAATHLASTALESIMSAKETSDPDRLGWRAVGNIGSNVENGVPQGIFVSGFQNVMSGAGPDEIVGTADDNGTVVPGYQRQIVITDQCDPERPSTICPTPGSFPIRIRTVQVTVNYFVGAVTRQEQLNMVLTDYGPR